MASSPSSSGIVSPRSGEQPVGIPELIYYQGGEQSSIILKKLPYKVGRKTENDLVISDARVSREHAQLVEENGEYFVVDNQSKHGTYVNGERIEGKRKLFRNDRVEFGVREEIYIVFSPTSSKTSTTREFLSQISGIDLRAGGGSDLEKLTFFLDAARRLNTSNVLEEILVTLVEATLRLTGAERGYVFLRNDDGTLRLAAGRNSKGGPLADDKTISRSIIQDAARSASAFLVSDTMKMSGMAKRESVIAHDLRTVICIPLRRKAVLQKTSDAQVTPDVIGVLYLDSKYASRDLSTVGQDILAAIATEAAALVENARLVQAEEVARRMEQEMAIAASIQQRLMAVRIPELPFAKIQARNIPCKDIGGDFFDLVQTDDGLIMVITDVCGKGISAAILASILQGLVYSQALAGVPLSQMASTANSFLCNKELGEKYATVVVAKLTPDGTFEYVNCGHVPPLIVSGSEVVRLGQSNLPVGLLRDATYEAGTVKLKAGDRLIVVTDGVTEAENKEGEFFGYERLEEIAKTQLLDGIFNTVREYAQGVPLGDDCTIFELTYRA
ncbi:MAG TPA: SpoIIE family protein phosphatase [Terriglobales bacterium]|nr:SpoIIE family protein phosphatase [Terriglobales bacterium]